jgi:murein DD-endopeptidase MepM/ murein hydrolase activator NlpD
MRRTHKWVAAALGAVLLVGVAGQGPAAADDLTDRQNQLAQQAQDAASHVDGQAALLAEANGRVAAAQSRVADAEAAVAAAQDRVTEAQAAVAAAQAEVQKAKDHDAAMAVELAAAEEELAAARAKEAQGQAALQAERDQLAKTVRLNFQQNNSLIQVSTVLNPGNGSADLANRLQWAETSLTASQSGLDRLEVIQRALIEAGDVTEVAQARADDAKLAAEEQVRQTEAAEAAARDAEQALRSALAAQQGALDEQRSALGEEQAAQAASAGALADAQAKLTQLRAEEAAVAAEIAARAEAARKAANPPAANPPAGSSGLIRPIPGAWISSPFGWRTNPIGRFSELHDGTDFAANCWTPIHAVASGQVIKSYFGDGYGYRVFVEHGYVAGRHMVSGYNHMVQPGLPAGTWVNQGDVVGYVGTTGYSTGCHLHFHLWVDGQVTNAMNYLP